MFNENIVSGKWKQMKGKLLEVWGKVTDDEMEQTKGNISKLAGLVQQRYGESQETIRERINEFLADIGGVNDDASDPEFKTYTPPIAKKAIESEKSN